MSEQRDCCPECGSVVLSPTNNKHGTATHDGYYCDKCGHDVVDPDQTDETPRCKPATGLARKLWEAGGEQA